MNLAASASEIRRWCERATNRWDQFWFTARSPYVLSLIRIATGSFLLYSHLVLATDLSAFLGTDAWISPELARSLHDGKFGDADWGRSYLWLIENGFVLWMHHGLTLAVTLAFTVGCFTRITGPAAWFLQLMYIHRLTGALFGLDQIITYMAMYLSFAPCGASISIDARLRKRFTDKLATSAGWRWLLPDEVPSVACNIATRLLQIHLCVIYLFGGLAKARGESWWDGTAIWYAVGNYEYQSLDMTWLATYPRLFSFLTHITLFWEVFYCFLIWPKLLRPITLILAVAIHGGIALFMGMATFGLAMICANAIFVDPVWLRRLVRGEPAPVTLATENDLDAGGLDLEDVDFDDAGSHAKIIERAKKVRAAGDRVRKRYLMLKEREQELRQNTKELERQKRRFARRTGKDDEKPPV